MANVENNNTFYVDSTGSLTSDKNVKVSAIIYTASAANSTITFKDADTSGALKMTLKALANETIYIDFQDKAIVFPNGIYISAITASSAATLVIKGGKNNG